MSRPLRLFISYAREDEFHRLELEKRLKQLHREGLVETWHDRKLLGGDEWKQQIEQHLQESDVILLLVSPDFLYSDYCYDTEMKQAVARHEQGTATVIPIIVRPSDWKTTPIGIIQSLALPRISDAVSTCANPDVAWLNISDGIREITEKENIKFRISDKSTEAEEFVEVPNESLCIFSEKLNRTGKLHRLVTHYSGFDERIVHASKLEFQEQRVIEHKSLQTSGNLSPGSVVLTLSEYVVKNFAKNIVSVSLYRVIIEQSCLIKSPPRRGCLVPEITIFEAQLSSPTHNCVFKEEKTHDIGEYRTDGKSIFW